MKTIALINQKGGVGKTTTTINLGAGLAELGHDVLLIDLDPQAHLTYALGLPAHELDATVYELLKEETPLDEVIVERAKNLRIIPSSLNLSGAEMALSSVAGREFLLKEALEPLTHGPGYILIDCPPSLGLLTINALTAASEVYIPVQTEFLALQGMSSLIQTVEVIQRRLNKELSLGGIIATRYDNRKTLNREVVAKIREYFGDKLFRTVIRDNVSLAEAPGHGQTIFEYRARSNGAKDFRAVCAEMVERADK